MRNLDLQSKGRRSPERVLTPLKKPWRSFRAAGFSFILLTFVIPGAIRPDAPIAVTQAEDFLLIGKQTFFYEDVGAKLSLADILKPELEKKFIRGDRDLFARPVTKSAFWFRITVQNLTDEDLWLEAATTFAWYLDFYAPNTSGNYGEPHFTGSMRPESSKLFNTNTFWLPLNRGGDTGVKTYYLRVTEQFPFELPLHVGTRPALQRHKSVHDNLTAGFIAVMLVMLIYNAFLFISTRDSVYIPYLAYIALALLTNTFLSHAPVLQQLIFPGIPTEWWHRSFLLWHPPINIPVGFFCIGYLGLNKKYPLFKKLIWLQLGILALFPCLTVIGVEPIHLVGVYQPLALLLPFTCLAAAAYAYAKSDRSARYYLLGWSFFVCTIIIFIGVINGIIAYNQITRNALYFGISAEVILFSFGLTERIKIQQLKLLSHSNKLLRQASQLAHIGGWEYLPGDRRFHWSEMVCEMYGVSPKFQPTLARAWSFYKDPLSRKQISGAFQTCLNAGMSYDVELQITKPDGRTAWIRTTGHAEFRGKVCLRVSGTCQDITDQKVAAFKLEEARSKAAIENQKFRLLAEYSAHPLLLYDATGILECNPAAAKILGAADRCELLGKHPALFSPEYQPDGRLSCEKSQEMDALAHKHGFHRFEWLHRTLADVDFPVEVTLIPVRLSGQQTLLVVWYDLTEIKAQEERLTAAKIKAEAASEAKSEFLSTMSHEIRTPMTGLIGMASLLQETQLDDDQKRYVEIINRSGENLVRLIDDILDFSRIEAGKLELSSEPFDPIEICEEVVRLMSVKAYQHKTVLTTIIDPEINYLVRGDEFRLKQILANLIGNAVKFTEEGAIVLTLKPLALSEGFVSLEISVADTGVGIPADKIDLLFAPFTQADGSITRRYGGSGLGLSICQRLIDLMAGEISIESKEGRGTKVTVRLKLPVAADDVGGGTTTMLEAAGVSEAAPLEAPSRNISVLVVDDDEIIRSLLVQIFEKLGHKVATATDGLEAVDKYSQIKYDLVTMDTMMPNLDGHQAIARIRELSGSSKTPVIISITAVAEIKNTQEAIRIGANDSLTKPFTLSGIEAKLKKLAYLFED